MRIMRGLVASAMVLISVLGGTITQASPAVGPIDIGFDSLVPAGPRVGEPFNLTFAVVANWGPFGHTNQSINSTPPIAILSGLTSLGDLHKGERVPWRVGMLIDRPGTYEVDLRIRAFTLPMEPGNGSHVGGEFALTFVARSDGVVEVHHPYADSLRADNERVSGPDWFVAGVVIAFASVCVSIRRLSRGDERPRR